ncbi:hypothetical protein HanRHA438_Chr02g0060571 [Helianthus annuus]|nr:hypothetical protein HanRHA438_Chr02g0060571 [Helianthus annuus]
MEKNEYLFKDFPTLTKHTRRRIQGRVYVDTDDHTTRKFVIQMNNYKPSYRGWQRCVKSFIGCNERRELWISLILW